MSRFQEADVKEGDAATKGKLASLRAVAVGNALEWFDWTLYGLFSSYLAMHFFENDDPTSALLATLAVFAGGFLARPIGGLLFGALGDKIGRKAVLIVTMLTMAGSTLLIALIPTFDQIGVWASVLLLSARLLQGLAHGGEAGVSYTYVAEIAPPKRRGLWTSAVFFSVTIGVIAATALAALLTAVLATEAMESYGWRLGFATGALLGVYVLFLRRNAVESDVFEENKTEEQQAVVEPPRTSKRDILRIAARIVMLSAVTNVAYYTWVTFAPATAISTHGMDPNGAYVASLLAQVLVLILLPICGIMSDKVGRRKMYMAFGIAVAVVVFPVQAVLTDQSWTLFVSQGIGLAVWAMTASFYPAIVAEQVPTRVRAMGVGLLTSISVAIFGGTAPYLNTWLTSLGLDWVFMVYVGCLGLVAAVAAFFMKETSGADLNEIEEIILPQNTNEKNRQGVVSEPSANR